MEADPASKAAFLKAMEEEGQHYLNIAAALQEKHKAEFLAQGLDEKEANKKAEKLANEDARFVLPNACETKMVVTMNARSLQNFFRLRCYNRAQWEIRALAEEMYKLVYPIAPNLFAKSGPGCVYGGCTDVKMTCGKAAEDRAHYQALKTQALGQE